MEFQKFSKIPRLSRDITITEKIDGGNGIIFICPKDNLLSRLYLEERLYISNQFIDNYCLDENEDSLLFSGSRKRWLDTSSNGDNQGFAKWVKENSKELFKLGEGIHYGEWYGCFPPETSIKLSDGSLMNIGKIVNQKLPLEVLSYNIEKDKLETKKIVDWHKYRSNDNWITIKFSRRKRGGKNTNLTITKNHKVFVLKNNQIKEIKAGELKKGNELLVSNKKIWKDINYGLLTTKILDIKEGVSNSIKKRKSDKYMYDLTIADNSNYFARDILVHNSKIQRKYDLNEKRFSLFNVSKWHQKGCATRLISIDPKTKEERYTQEAPECCEVVPILYEGEFDTNEIELVLHKLKTEGSKVAPGFMEPEGIVIYHKASGKLYKKTIEKDEQPKGI